MPKPKLIQDAVQTIRGTKRVDSDVGILLNFLQLHGLSEDVVEGWSHRHRLRRRVLAGQANEYLLEGSVKELRIAVSPLNDLTEESAAGTGDGILLVLALIWERIDEGDGEMDRHQLGMGILLGQDHGVLQRLLGPIREFHL